ncbi:unnamed protein product [Somion occarium]|uniref:Uncharacterized protein n=1 Tax=Somion occarium TaxID=3059160 RepID=A0ABP1E2H1_9APHY
MVSSLNIIRSVRLRACGRKVERVASHVVSEPMHVDTPMTADFISAEQSLHTESTPCTNSLQQMQPLRQSRRPLRHNEPLPEPPAGLNTLRRVVLVVRDTFDTARNVFGIWRRFLHRPSHDPDAAISLDDLAQYPSASFNEESAHMISSMPNRPETWPYLNSSIALLMNWVNNGSTNKSEAQVDELVHDVLLHPDFRPSDLGRGFSTNRQNARLSDVLAQMDDREDGQNTSPSSVLPDFHFKETEINIEVPSCDRDVPPRQFSIPGLQYRNLVDVVRTAFTDKLSPYLHYSPFKLFQRLPNSDNDRRVFSELYNSDAFLEEDDWVKRKAPLPPDDQGCRREKVVAALMFWSDATHLADFGTAKLWPIYLMFGNLSKYIRSQPESGACHHLAYIPSLPDWIQDEIAAWHPKWHTQKKDILTHCRRELMQAVWRFLLDDEFLHAYKYGIVICCSDGVERCVYPRFFTYSADYPEKILLATIRDQGLCPCPRCLTSKSSLGLFGQSRDLAFRLGTGICKYMFNKVTAARELIYRKGYAIASSRVEDLLKPTSSTPTANAFVERLGDDTILHRMLVVDFMHEFELGTWKALFTHLIRLLYAQPNGDERVAELDRRYREIPRFGRDTIRRFANKASEMKKLGARDFEDLLQCAIPAFEGLFPDESDDKAVSKLLFKMAEWHGFAKLRMHTEETIAHLEELTRSLAKLVRHFHDVTCPKFHTRELPREAMARQRRKAQSSNSGAPAASTASRKYKALNLNTYKWHAMPDYPAHIRRFGTTDNYSTQIVSDFNLFASSYFTYIATQGEHAHCVVKRIYRLGPKCNHENQIGKRYMRIRYSHWKAHRKQTFKRSHDPSIFVPPELHHYISPSLNNPIDLSKFMHNNRTDPAVTNFIPKLKDHLLGCLLGQEFDGDNHGNFSDADRNCVRIANNQIYSVNTVCFNYTTYDVRRDQDSVNPMRQCNVMIKSMETRSLAGAHSFWYARVLGVYHATVSVIPTSENCGHIPSIYGRHMEFLWVRWYGAERGYRSGFKFSRLPKIGFVPDDDPFAFGFLDPSYVLRGCHLMPAFNEGKTTQLLHSNGDSIARKAGVSEDWLNFYVGIFVDRDMLLRHYGAGVGHLAQTQTLSPTEAGDSAMSDVEEVEGREYIQEESDVESSWSDDDSLLIDSDSGEDDSECSTGEQEEDKGSDEEEGSNDGFASL